MRRGSSCVITSIINQEWRQNCCNNIDENDIDNGRGSFHQDDTANLSKGESKSAILAEGSSVVGAVEGSTSSSPSGATTMMTTTKRRPSDRYDENYNSSSDAALPELTSPGDGGEVATSSEASFAAAMGNNSDGRCVTSSKEEQGGNFTNGDRSLRQTRGVVAGSWWGRRIMMARLQRRKM